MDGWGGWGGKLVNVPDDGDYDDELKPDYPRLVKTTISCFSPAEGGGIFGRNFQMRAHNCNKATGP